ncbi:hypothetical protein PF005_g4258 [Phytophthora fragariae]|uniref:Uncharacterized protein n=1 Tax=Phytophthora fragariae TaxID=53985 RepID=A0A6A4ECY7_9STRA|nr:hypothetical protein PF003_g19271 [Phytophthora fragariae]KAE8945608.1 hypothetical protein PF009_g4733 [Phytophthora fragariae]KAE9130823.1 hypothetical protein PF007_g4352 [Phytophthora fragariae]KAE9152209.1 hypothetical protein PF006_g3550 [Phytophthora fragariae]KAE9228564.1 hypothetical protein PF005_g4258 [Phytophthora fragariae]
MQSTTRSSSAGKRLIPWNNDSVGRGGPTSMDVLLEWLRTPGNYALWHKQSARCRASTDLLAMLKGNGIGHRTASGINSKIKKMIRGYLSAVEVLREEGLPCDYLEGEDVDEDIEGIVLKECPEFRALEPIFRGWDFRGLSQKDWATCNYHWTTSEDSEASDYDESYGSRATKRKAAHASGRRSSRSKRLRSTQRAVQDTGGAGKWLVTTCLDATADLRRKMVACTLGQVKNMFKLHLATARIKDECEVQVARCRLQTEQHRGELERGLDDIKLDTERRQQEMQLESERRQKELKLKVDTLKSRQALKNQRVPTADIDRVLPLSALQNDP